MEELVGYPLGGPANPKSGWNSGGRPWILNCTSAEVSGRSARAEKAGGSVAGITRVVASPAVGVGATACQTTGRV